MSYSASGLINAAHSFYLWSKGIPSDEQGFEAIREFLGADISLEQFRQLEERLRSDQAFDARNGPLIARWQARMERPGGLSEEGAGEFLQELFEGFDHALLFDQGVTVGVTHLLRGHVNYQDKAFTGSMPCWTLHYTVAGDALFLGERAEQHVQAGDLMLLKPEAQYHYGLHPMAQEWRHLWALFQPRQHWQELLQWPETDDGILCLSVGRQQDRELIEKLFNDIIALRDQSLSYQTDLQYNRLEEILIRAREYSDDLIEARVDGRIQQACDYMEARLRQRIANDDVAQACNLSSSRFAHLFKEQMGLSPKAWINNLRLQRARKLLLSGNASVQEVATQVGFEDASHFTRYFSKNVGCSPRDFRKSFTRLASGQALNDEIAQSS